MTSNYKYNFECPKCGDELRYQFDSQIGKSVIFCSSKHCDFKEIQEDKPNESSGLAHGA